MPTHSFTEKTNRMNKRSRTLIVAILLVVLVEGGNDPFHCLNMDRDDITITLDNNTSEISMKLFNNIAVIDSTKDGFTCEWGDDSCFVECTNPNFTACSVESTTLDKNKICAQGSSNTAFNISTGLFECEFTKCLPEPFLNLIRRKSIQRPQGIRELKRLLIMKEMCKNLFNRPEIKRAFIGIERDLIKNVLRNPFAGEELIYDLSDLVVKVANLNSLKQTEGSINIDSFLLSSTDLTHLSSSPKIRIPVEILLKIPEGKRKVAVVLYKSPDQFLFSGERPHSVLIRVELLEEEYAEKMENPLQMTFQVFNLSIDQAALECQFYDEWAKGTTAWSNRGCTTQLADQGVLCSCDHMTPFAVLLVLTDSIDLNTWKIQSIVSYVGTGLSAFFTAASILTHVILRSPSQDHSGSIHMSLSGALFLLNVSFLANEWLANMGVEPLCMFISLLMHYGLLCSFTWMAIEALHLYLLIVRVFNTYIHLYLTKLALLGWGFPAVVVVLAYAIKSQPNLIYGLEVITVGNTTSSLCWITDKWYFYGMNLSYFVLIFLFNNSILLTVSVRICQMKAVGQRTSTVLPWKPVCMVLGLTCLLGSTWGLAFLSYGPLSVPMQYLFCIFNSLQGFFIFLWIFRTSRKAKREAASKTTSKTTF